MTDFIERDRAFEKKFALDEETNFKINARRNKLLGLWAAEKLGKSGADAEAYAKDVVVSDFESAGPGDVIAKLLKDFREQGQTMSENAIEAEMSRLMPVAREQILAEKK